MLLGPRDLVASPRPFPPSVKWSELNILGLNCPTDFSPAGIFVSSNPPHPLIPPDIHPGPPQVVSAPHVELQGPNCP